MCPLINEKMIVLYLFFFCICIYQNKESKNLIFFKREDEKRGSTFVRF